jgi:hypothetical protein
MTKAADADPAQPHKGAIMDATGDKGDIRLRGRQRLVDAHTLAEGAARSPH